MGRGGEEGDNTRWCGILWTKVSTATDWLVNALHSPSCTLTFPALSLSSAPSSVDRAP